MIKKDLVPILINSYENIDVFSAVIRYDITSHGVFLAFVVIHGILWLFVGIQSNPARALRALGLSLMIPLSRIRLTPKKGVRCSVKKCRFSGALRPADG